MKPHPYIKKLAEIKQIIKSALKEDIGQGDITSQLTISSNTQAIANLIAKQNGILAGSYFVRFVFQTLSPDIKIRFYYREGDYFQAGNVLAKLQGNARALLSGERT
ncbi:MAG: nicotinate-nucleotide diphosphorylase (carboxylating), partial [candidate division WOR-3 bacterium]|nr:nicotinate-nucleotide diphosphorylase (carboxylating) [candidate division WOR-3 bacterium]